MRIRWTDNYIEESKELSFNEYGMTDENGTYIPQGITFSTGDELIGDSGELNMDYFGNIEEAKKWTVEVCDKVMVDGYYDFRPDEAAGRIILY